MQTEQQSSIQLQCCGKLHGQQLHILDFVAADKQRHEFVFELRTTIVRRTGRVDLKPSTIAHPRKEHFLENQFLKYRVLD